MRSVFQLKDRELTVAVNAPGTVTYVVQVFDEPSSDLESLRRAFTSTAYTNYNPHLAEMLRQQGFRDAELSAQQGPAIVSIYDVNDIRVRLFDQIEKIYDVEWVEKDPDEAAAAEQT
jgi:hypothetical protein